MLVFVDESGDSGMKGKRGSSELFVVTAVLFVENADAESCDSKIAQIASQCFRGKKREFKFNKCCDAHREKFIRSVLEFDFLYLAFALNKAKLWGAGFAYKESFYKYTCKLLFQNAKPYLQHATVVIDQSGNREFRKQLERYLKDKINTESEVIRRVRTESSHSNNLLQLADMTCGAVARSFRTDRDDPGYFRSLLIPKELKVEVWPKMDKS
jgi:hypothetical protein